MYFVCVVQQKLALWGAPHLCRRVDRVDRVVGQVHASAQATNIVIKGNRPGGPGPPPPPGPPPQPSSTLAFCSVAAPEACVAALSGTGVEVGACSANYEHVEQHELPAALRKTSIKIDALHVLAVG